MEILGLVDIPLALVLVVMVLVSLYIYQTWHFNTWRKLGIAGPKPRPLLGNIPMGARVDFLAEFAKWKKQYGDNYGMFVFRDPVFVSSDPEVMKEVMVKHFNNFTNRYSGFNSLLTEFSWKMLFNSQTPAWRRYRHAMTPAFTTGKLKALQGYMIRCSKTLAEVLKDNAKKQEDIDLKETYQKFTMDVIAGTAFGLDTNLQKGEGKDSHDMIQAMKGILSTINSFLAVFLAVAFPFLAPLLRALGYTAFPQKDLAFFQRCITAIIRQRDREREGEREGEGERERQPEQAKSRVDFLQQMMDIRVAEGEEVTDVDNDTEGTKICKKLTEEEVLAQGIQVFNAGFETTASTLRFLTYCLALHQDVQRKLHQEIMEVVGQGEVTYESLLQLKYLECVILETLRLYPIIPNLSRIAEEPVDVMGYHIPKGMGVVLGVYTATHDPLHYPDPFTFNPDRFADGKDTFMASLPFGVGPRQCIGMRLAMQEIKTAIVHVCRVVRFVPCEKTPKTLDLDARALLIPFQPVIVRTETRT